MSPADHAQSCQHHLSHRGINYDTGVNYMPGSSSREFWRSEAAQHDMRVIARDLHCDAVTVLGTDLERLREAAEFVLAEGMDVWIQPRLVDGTRAACLKHLAEAAELAEELRVKHPGRIALNIGCELSLFMRGILPGWNFWVRMRGLMVYWLIMSVFNRRLNAHLRNARGVARSRFNGPITYSSGEWESVDWDPFDYVGVDYYMDSNNASKYVDGLRSLKRHGKPVVVTEFGCCSFRGADEKGGSGFLIIRWSNPPTVKPGHERDEQVQADYIEQLRGIYKREGIDAAFTYAFSEPTNTYSQDPTYDLDMASYGIVKVVQPATCEQAEVWEPKAAFTRLSELNVQRQ